MFKAVSLSYRKPKSSRTEKKTNIKPRQAQEIDRLHMMAVDLQSRLRHSQELNSIYLTQIKKLEDDNLALCARLQEVKIQSEGTFRGFIQDKDKLKLQANDLLRIICQLEKEVEEKTRQNIQLRAQLEQTARQAEVGIAAEIRSVELGAEVERAKVKLLQSEKYWIIRCQTLLQQQKTQSQRFMLEREAEFKQKLKHIGLELAQKQQEVKEKTTEIYKLIGHIHSLAR